MNRRIAMSLGFSFVFSAFAVAQPAALPAAKPGYYPAAPGPVMAIPASVLFADQQSEPMPGGPAGPAGPGGMMGGGFSTVGPTEAAPRYPVDENGNRAINWLYSQSDFLFGWSKDKGDRTLGTSGDTTGRGVLGESGTASLGSTTKFNSTFGFRQTIGIWLTPSRTFGFETSAFTFQKKTTGFTANSSADGSPVLSRPFLDATTDSENARIVAYPGAFAGGISAEASQRIYGADAGFVINTIERESFGVDFLIGFKFVTLLESIDTADMSTALANGLVAYNGATFGAPSAVGTQDHISTANRFYGSSLGLRLGGDYERLSYSFSARCGLGWVRQSQAASGSTTFYGDGVNPTASTPTGMLIFPANGGEYKRTVFAALPELGLKLGYRVTNRMTASIGYDMMYLSNAVRPGEAISQPINPTLLPSGNNFGVPFGPTTPTGGISSSNFMLHTLTCGVVVVF